MNTLPPTPDRSLDDGFRRSQHDPLLTFGAIYPIALFFSWEIS